MLTIGSKIIAIHAEDNSSKFQVQKRKKVLKKKSKKEKEIHLKIIKTNKKKEKRNQIGVLGELFMIILKKWINSSKKMRKQF